MAVKMFTLFNLAISKGIEPKGIRTDAIFLVSEPEEQLKKLFHFDASEIGGLKLETGKYCTNQKTRQQDRIIRYQASSCEQDSHQR